MITTIILLIENPIVRLGLESIIKINLIPSQVLKNIQKENLLRYIRLNTVHFVVIELMGNKKTIEKIAEIDSTINIITYTKSSSFRSKDFYNTRNITFSSSESEIISVFYKSFEKKKNYTQKKQSVKLELVTKLSNRENQVMECLIQGYTISDIARKNGFAISTIGTYKKRIFEKLNVTNLIELIIFLNKI